MFIIPYKRTFIAVLIFPLILLCAIFLNITPLHAQLEISHRGGILPTEEKSATNSPGVIHTASTPSILSTQTALTPEALAYFQKFELKGDYTAVGVGLRGKTAGVIELSSLPVNASIHRAYLYWSFLDDGLLQSEQSVTFNGKPVTGTEIGSGNDTCWDRTNSRAFRADVTSLVTGNGPYILAGIENQFPILAQGASLVVIYGDEYGALRTIILQDGNAVINNANTSLATTIHDFTAHDEGGGVSAKTTFVVGDGQNFTDTSVFGAGSSTLTLFNTLNGSDGGLWDTDTYDVSSYIASGDTSASFRIFRGTDCLNWVAQIFSVTSAANTPKFSNVLFLPGLGGSRLYKPEILQGQDKDRLWEPNEFNDIPQLGLSNTTYKSNNTDIYTRDIVDETLLRVDDWPGTNTYKSFVNFMDNNVVGEGIINEWKAIPYDWRLDLNDILASGKKTGDDISYLVATGTPYILQELRRLAETSRTGKVTLITHSNGGLLAKELLRALEAANDPLLGKIDKLVLVASPQVGTPEAVAALLHGTTKIFKGVAREFSENMPAAYHLLPSRSYFSSVTTPVISFSSEIANVTELSDLAGSTITDYDSLRSFMTGRNGAWSEPNADDIDTPNVLKEGLLNYAEGVHFNLDTWLPPSRIQVIQIAGTGIDTVGGIEYDDCDTLFCPDTLNHLERTLKNTKRGDGTVVIPSALWMSTSTLNVERYYVDVDTHNDGRNRNRDHASILEIDSLQDFLKNIIQNQRTFPDEFIRSNEPDISNNISLNFRLHSPVQIHLYDSRGNHTGLIPNPDFSSGIRIYEKNIPNSYYREFGEVKYVGVGNSASTTIVLRGEDLGTFTLEIDETQGDTIRSTTTFNDIPVSASTTATMVIPLGGFSSSTPPLLQIDIDGDGRTDASLSTQSDPISVSFALLAKIVETMDMHHSLKHELIQSLEKAIKDLEKGKTKHTIKELEKMIRKLEKEIEKNIKKEEKTKISTEDARKLIEIMEKLKANMVE